MTKRLFFLVLLHALAFRAFGQTAGIRLIASVKKDSIILRWAPSSAIAWEIANRQGYTLRRYTVPAGGRFDSLSRPEEVVLLRQPTRPWPLAQWEALAKQDKYAAIAAQALYGKSFTLSTATQSSAMQLYNQVQEKESRWSFALLAADHSAGAAEALALRFVDTKFKKGEKYVYRVAVEPAPKQAVAIGTGTAYVDAAIITRLPVPEDVKAEFGDLAVGLNWNSFYLRDVYVSYRVERSEDGKNFGPANGDLAFLNTTEQKELPDRTFYMDSLPQNSKVYYYRVRGVTPFGETGPPSALVKGVGLPSTKGALPVVEVSHIFDDKKAFIQWRYPRDQYKNIKGFSVGRASDVNGPFKDITRSLIEPGINAFTDPSPAPVNYYVVRAVAHDGTVATSFPYMIQLDDETPPVAPAGVHGTIDSLGIVTLTWSPNLEPDLVGYRIYRANDLEEEFTQRSHDIVRTNSFTDTVTLKTLTKQVFYKVVAFDTRFNPSAYSQILTLERPDIIPPAATQFVKATSARDHILLEWLPGVSNDIAGYELWRSSEKDTTTQKIAVIDEVDKIYQYRDTALVAGIQYRYAIRVRDKAGLTSAPAYMGVNFIDYGIRASVKNIQHAVNREKHTITLQWSYPEADIKGFQIFRSVQGGPLRLHTFYKGTRYTDRNLTINTVYGYAVKPVFHSGADGEISEILTITH